MSRLEKLNHKLDKRREKYKKAIKEIEIEIKKLTGCEDDVIAAKDTADGVVICYTKNNTAVSVPIDYLNKILDNTGKLTIDDMVENTFV